VVAHTFVSCAGAVRQADAVCSRRRSIEIDRRTIAIDRLTRMVIGQTAFRSVPKSDEVDLGERQLVAKRAALMVVRLRFAAQCVVRSQ
jgi:hypothetical protein